MERFMDGYFKSLAWKNRTLLLASICAPAIVLTLLFLTKTSLFDFPYCFHFNLQSSLNSELTLNFPDIFPCPLQAVEAT